MNPRRLILVGAVFSAPKWKLAGKVDFTVAPPLFLQAHIPGVLQSADGGAGKGRPEDSCMQNQ